MTKYDKIFLLEMLFFTRNAFLKSNYHLYSSKFTLSVINLTQTELATEEDKANKVDYWARLFKAKTWEEIKMLAQNNELDSANAELATANAELATANARIRELENALASSQKQV